MKYWIVINNRQEGPFELQQLEMMELDYLTPVWYPGLSEWIPARDIPEVREMIDRKQNLFNQTPESAETTGSASFCAQQAEYVAPESVQDDPQQSQPAGHQGGYKNGAFQESATINANCPKCPSTHLAWSIIVTLLCCIPLGVVAIIFSASVTPKYERGDYEGALKASERAEWFIILAIVIGLISAPFQTLIPMMFK